MDFEVCR